VPDVFISYAHEDATDVERLRAALRLRGREVWLDTSTQPGEGIPPVTEWSVEALDGIDRSDAFVFVLSPSSLASTPCATELDHAVEMNKRLIPVCVTEPPTSIEIPRCLSELRWVMLRPSDPFDVGVDELIQAADTDIDIVHEHTRILVRARAWDLAQRRTSPLLRGEELRSAERWLARAAGAGVAPTEVQRDFVIASRRTTTRRQRIVVAVSLAIATAAIALAVFALVQRSDARHQATLANSRALAAGAQAVQGIDPEQAIRESARAVRTSPTPEATHALSTALEGSLLRAVLDNDSSPVLAVAFSPDGLELAVGSMDGSVRLWRLTDRTLVWTAAAGGPGAESLSFTGDGRKLVVGRSSEQGGRPGCATDVLNAATGRLERTLGSSATVGTCARFADVLGTTHDVAISTETGVLGVWDADDAAAVGPRVREPLGGDGATSLAVSPNGRRLAIADLLKVVVVGVTPERGLSLGAPTTTIETCWCTRTRRDAAHLGIAPQGAAFSPDGKRLFVAGQLTAATYDLRDGVSTTLYSQGKFTAGGAWSGNDRIIAASGSFGALMVWTSGGQLLEVLRGGTGDFTAEAMTADGTLAGGIANGSVRIWDADPDLWNDAIPISGVSVDWAVTVPGAGVVAVGDPVAGVRLVDADGRVVGTLRPHGDEMLLAAARSTLAFVVGRRAEAVGVPSGQLVRAWRLPHVAPNDAPQAVATSVDARVVVVAYPDRIVSLGPGNSERSAPLHKDEFDQAQLSLTPDGHLIALTRGSLTEVLDAQLHVVRRFVGLGAVFSPNGSLLAVDRPGGEITLLRSSTWRLRATATGSRPAGSGLTVPVFSPDGRLLATIGGDGDLRVWDAADGAVVAAHGVFAGGAEPNGTFPIPALTDRGEAFVSDSEQDVVHVYDVCDQCLDAQALLRQADARLAQIAPTNGR
jgi:WD40 repeat protein